MPSDPRQIRRRHWFALAAIVLVAALLRLHRLSVPVISGDEMCSVEASAGRGQSHLFLPGNTIITPAPNLAHVSGASPIWTIPAAMRQDVHPPLYFLLLRIWEGLFGDGVTSIRVMSVLAGLAGVVIIFDVGRLLDGVWTGLWAAMLMTVAQPQITYSQDARPYSLAITLTLASADALMRIVRLGPSRRRTIALYLSLLATCLTHYFAVPAAFAMGFFGVIFTRQGVRRNLILASVAAAVTALALWSHGLWSQHANFFHPAYYWYADNAPRHVAQVLERAALLPIRFLADPLNSSSTLLAAGGASALYLLPWLLGRRRPEFFLLGLWLVSCVGLVSILDLCWTAQLATVLRYTLAGAPAIYLLIPMLSHRPWLNASVAAGAVLYCLLYLPQAYDIENLDFSHMAAEIDRHAGPGDVLLIDSQQYFDGAAGAIYMGVQRLATNMPQTLVLIRPPAPARLLAELAARRTGRFFMIYWREQLPDDLLPGWGETPLARYPRAGTFCQLAPPRSAP
jgi:hypothetical protein